MSRRALNYDVMTKLGRDVASDDLIVLMQEEDELAAQKEILEKMRPELRKKLKKIKELIEAEVHSALLNRYALGEHFQAIYDDETSNGAKVYGKGAVKNIVRLLGIDESLVRNCMKFAQLYSREDLEDLCTRLLPRGEHLTWSHVRCLVQVEDGERREELLEKAIDEGWTCAELAHAVKGGDDDGKESNSGRPPRIPATFDGMIQQQKQAVDQWERRNQKVWDHPQHSITVKAQELPDEEVTEERLKEAGELAYQLRGLADQANRAAERAEAVVERFMQILKARMGKDDHEEKGAREKTGKVKKVAEAA